MHAKHKGGFVQISCKVHFTIKWEETDPKSSKASCTVTYFSCGELPIAGLSWLGFCGGWGFCCSGGRPPGPLWPGAVGRGCWVVGAPGRPCCSAALCCCCPPCDSCLGGCAGLCCWGWPPAGFWPGPPADGFCGWETDCCLWACGEPPWLRWGEPWPEVGLWPGGGPWPVGRDWALGSPAEGLAARCWTCAGGWPWGCGRCWDGGLCWGPPTKENSKIFLIK